jgi:ketosteroid isomerase-like protein
MGSEERERNKQTIRRVLAAYVEGDLAPLFAVFDDDVEWTSNALAGHYRFGGPHKGKSA